jgi:hypothetical protein
MTTVSLIADGDDLVLPLPDSMCEDLNWKDGDTVMWTDNNDGTFSLTKVEPAVQSKPNGGVDHE